MLRASEAKWNCVSHKPLAGYDCTRSHAHLLCIFPFSHFFLRVGQERRRLEFLFLDILGAAGMAGRWLGLQWTAWAYKVGSWEITNG